MPSAAKRADQAMTRMSEAEKDALAQDVLDLVKAVAARTGHLTRSLAADRITP